MSDWDFLHEMHERGYTSKEIADAAGCGLAPWELDGDWIEAELKDEPEDDAFSVKPAEPFRSRDGFPLSIMAQTEIFQNLVDCAARHYENTGRYLQVWGELGEIYAEIKFGLCRHATHTAGSDGTISGKRVEVKTISPEKTGNQVRVKRQGDFEQLLIVRIDKDFNFRAKFIERARLKGSGGKFLQARLPDDVGADQDPSCPDVDQNAFRSSPRS